MREGRVAVSDAGESLDSMRRSPIELGCEFAAALDEPVGDGPGKGTTMRVPLRQVG